MAANKVSKAIKQAQGKYEFEREDERFVAGGDAATDEDEKAFADRLEFKLDKNSPPHVKRVVRAYVIAVHRMILYYVTKRKEEETRYKWYMIGTGLLVVALPIVTAVLPSLMKDVAQNSIISTQIVAVIAGVFGVHRMYSTWMFRRNSAYAFWQASAQLKTLLYSLEQRWAQRALVGSSFDPLFLKALEDGKTAAEEVVTKEQESFFQALGNLKVDLQDIITKAVEGSGGITSKLAEPVIKEIAAREQKTAQIQGEVTKAREELVTLLGKRKLIEELVARLKNRNMAETDADRRSDLQGQIKNAEARLASIDFDLADKKSAYKAKLATAFGDKTQIT